MARLHVGLPTFHGDIRKYATRFDLVELHPVDMSLPKDGTLRTWRKTVPPGFVFSVVLPKVVGELRAGPALDAALEQALQVAKSVEARCMVVTTPASITPTALNKRRLSELIARLPRDAVTIAWEPTGLWELPEAAVVASKLDIALVVDAARETAPKGQVAYFRLRGLGESARLGPAAIDKVAASLRGRREGFVIIECDAAATVAKALKSSASRKIAPRPATTLLRPRTTLHAEDEEQ